MLSLFSCQDNFEGNSMSKKQIETIIIEGQDFIPSVESRTSVGDGGKFFWVRTDTLGIFPSRGGYQVAFPLTDMDGDEASTATFTGGGWALISGDKYMAYYPFDYDNRTPNFVPVTFAGQKNAKKNENGEWVEDNNYWGAYDYMWATGIAPSDGSVNFSFKHLCTLIQFKVKLNQDLNLTSIQLVSSVDDTFIEDGHFNLNSTTPEIVADKRTRILTLDLKKNVLVKSGEESVFYLCSAPFALSGNLTINVYSENKWYTLTKANLNLKWGAQSINTITINELQEGGDIAEGTKVINEETLKAALATPPADNTPIVIDGDITLTESLDVQSTTTIDLNGNSLNVGEQTINVNEGQTLNLINTSNYYSRSTVEVTNSITGSDDIIVVAKNSTITIGEGVNLKTTGADKCCVFVPIGAENVTINTAGNLLATQAGAATIQVNGNVTSGTITVTGGSVKHEKDVAIYAAGKVQLNISGGEIEGTTGVEIRAGELNVTGGKITATGDPFASTANGNGSTSVGAAVAVCQHNTDSELSATISGGTFNGVRALYEEDLENEEATDKITMSVTGGVFNGEIYSENVKGFISGGTFSHPSACSYMVSGKSFEFTMTEDVKLTAPIIVNSDITINLNGHNLTGGVYAESNGIITEGTTDSYVFWVKEK